MSSDDKSVLTLVNFFKPQLKAGIYRLTAKQTLGLSVDPKTVEWTREKEFYVRAPRFVLDPDEVYSVYPPNGQSGAYRNTIPHVVFASKTLPWEHSLLSNEPDTPWMALLLFGEDECTKNEIKITSKALTDVAKPESGIRGPNIQLDPWEKNEEPANTGKPDEKKLCMTIDVPWPLFRKIAPRLKELKYLAHARMVQTGDKEDVPGIGDGGFSVLLGNRVPTEEKQYFAFVVALEGLSDLISDGEPANPPTTVRLVVLSKWSFLSSKKTFEDLLDGLTLDDQNKKKDAWLRAAPPEAVKDATARTALGCGYVPMRHQFRHGKSTVSWYRGPLVPLQKLFQTRTVIYRSADEALQFDPGAGLFDVSYAAAWQLGRLLALQVPEFTRSLVYGDSSYVADALLAKAETIITKDEDELLQNELMAAIALEWCS
jgi:hypothetical protein